MARTKAHEIKQLRTALEKFVGYFHGRTDWCPDCGKLITQGLDPHRDTCAVNKLLAAPAETEL